MKTADARDMVRGEYHRPERVIAFNAEEGWSRDVSSEIARAVAEVAEEQERSLSRTTVEFLEQHLSSDFVPAPPL